MVKTHPLLAQTIQHGRLIRFTPITPQAFISQIIGQNQNNIWFIRSHKISFQLLLFTTLQSASSQKIPNPIRRPIRDHWAV